MSKIRANTILFIVAIDTKVPCAIHKLSPLHQDGICNEWLDDNKLPTIGVPIVSKGAT